MCVKEKIAEIALPLTFIKVHQVEKNYASSSVFFECRLWLFTDT